MKRIVEAILDWNYDDTYSWVECNECEGSKFWEDDVLGYVNSLIGCDALPADEYYAADNAMGYSGRIHNDKGEVYLFQKDALVAMFWQEEEDTFPSFKPPFEVFNKYISKKVSVEDVNALAEKMYSLNLTEKEIENIRFLVEKVGRRNFTSLKNVVENYYVCGLSGLLAQIFSSQR